MPHVTVSDRNAYVVEDELVYTVDSQHTEGITLRGYPILGLLVPVVNAGSITVEVSLDGGSTWHLIKQADGTTNAITITGGASAFLVSSDEFTPLAAYCGESKQENFEIKVRLATAASQAADRTFTWIGVA